jgi:hypothetical protein
MGLEAEAEGIKYVVKIYFTTTVWDITITWKKQKHILKCQKV